LVEQDCEGLRDGSQFRYLDPGTELFPPGHTAAAVPLQVENVPEPLRERGVLIEADELASA
jgi:hypothetical protein